MSERFSIPMITTSFQGSYYDEWQGRREIRELSCWSSYHSIEIRSLCCGV